MARALQLAQQAGWLRAEAQLHHMGGAYRQAIGCLLQDSQCVTACRHSHASLEIDSKPPPEHGRSEVGFPGFHQTSGMTQDQQKSLEGRSGYSKCSAA